jgi:carbonic anhydrase
MAKSSLIFTAFVALSLMGCNNQPQNSGSENNPVIDQPKALVEEVLTKEQRDALTPDEIIQAFKDGNERFIKNELTTRDHSAQIRKSASGQFPKAVILSCLVGRFAGNFVNVDLLGSMEFGCKVAGAKVILVLGHEHCGAVKSAIDDVKLGNITAMLSKIRPAVEKVSYEGDRTSGNPEFVHKVCESNVKHTIEQIRQNSPILKEMEDLGQIKIVGAVYDMDSGKVTFL